MWLLVGLGNPGDEYRDTRHNLGFMLIDRLACQANIKVTKPICQGLVGRGSWLGQEVILAKPQTYMNRSGESVKGLVKRFNIDSKNLIVAHDDLDLSLGRGKLANGGGSGGHNGVKSITILLGRSDFIRLKMGIGRPENPYKEPADYVLEPFGREEKELVDRILDRSVESVKLLLSRGKTEAQNWFNRMPPA